MDKDSINYIYIGSDSDLERRLRESARGEDIVCFGESDEVINGTSIIGAFFSQRIGQSVENILVRKEFINSDNYSLLQLILRAKSLRSVSGETKSEESTDFTQLLADFHAIEASGIKRYRGLQFYLSDKMEHLSMNKAEFESLRKSYPIKRSRIFAINGLKIIRHVSDLFLYLPTNLGFLVYNRRKNIRETHPEGIRYKYRMAFYRAIKRPLLAFGLKFKKRKRVAFVLADLGVWKTETLYKSMLADKRFEPVLAVVEAPNCNINEVKDYIERQGYDYSVVPTDKTICEVLHPDIIFYQKPYYSVVNDKHEFYNNTRALFCYAGYGMRSCTDRWITHSALVGNCWQIYYENESNRRLYSRLNKQCRFNGRATGLPVMDEMNLNPEMLPNPWKPSKGKKRIIYAPHFSIDPTTWTHSSTFLTLGEKMLDIARKYSDRVQWAFKPHPLLRSRLNEVWGKERTDEYYRQWAEAEWSQYENGRYAGLFAHSDALIHDCFSFTLEYLATGNPAMYLREPKEPLDKNLNDTHRGAMALHIQGNTIESIEDFIENIINGYSINHEEQRSFITEFLTPPAGGAVNAILKSLS